MNMRDKVKSLFGRSELPALPESFFFGVATADHQCEANNHQCEDIRDKWEAMPGHNPKAARGKATDFWNRYAQDIDLAANLGCKAFRFSIAWSRVEPRSGEFDPSAFDHYRDLIEEIISHNMKPILTLHHFTWPLHVETSGGLIGDRFPDIYARYVKEAARRFAGDVPYWITFNEPNLLMGGYLKPWWDADYAAPPGLPAGATTAEQVDAVGRLVRNLFLSHKKAYDIIKVENPKALVGVNQYIYGLPWWLAQLVNRNVSAIKREDDLNNQVDRLALKRDTIRGERISRFRAGLLEKDKVDVVMAALSKTSEREALVTFSEPYFLTRPQLMVRRDYPSSDARHLERQAIAAIGGSTSEQNLPRLNLESTSKIYDDYKSALASLDVGETSAILADGAILYGLAVQHPGKYRLLEERLDNVESYCAAIAKGDYRLLDVVNSVVKEFKASPESALLRARYGEAMLQSVDEPSWIAGSTVLNDSTIKRAETREMAALDTIPKASAGTALRRIQDRGYIVVAVREDLPGLGYRDPETSRLSGLEITLARRLSQRLFGDPDKVRFRPVTIVKRTAALTPESGLLDWIQKQYTILSTMLMANWWYMGMADELDDYLCPPGCERKMDFIGFDYYWGISSLHIERLQRLINAAYRRFDQAPVYPEGLYNTLKDLQNKFPKHPLIIFENGSVNVADGWEREKYIREHIKQVQRAIRDGIKAEGYICWSITSNREWDLEFNDASDFGLYHVDLDSDTALIRQRTPAADAFEQIIRNRRG